MNEETKSEAPSSPARATIPESERLERVTRLATAAGVKVSLGSYRVGCEKYDVSYDTIDELEAAIERVAWGQIIKGRALVRAMAKWREGR